MGPLAVIGRWWRCPPRAATLAATGLYVLGLTVLSVVPGTLETPQSLTFLYSVASPNVQNALHVPAYGLLAILLCKTCESTALPVAGVAAVALVAAVGYGVLMEWVQLFVPGRYAGLLDAAMNLLGAAVACSAYCLLRPTQRSCRDVVRAG